MQVLHNPLRTGDAVRQMLILVYGGEAGSVKILQRVTLEMTRGGESDKCLISARALSNACVL